jgi:5'-nucleotidase
MEGFAVEGRPADCVKVALRGIWQERFGEGSRPDVTISGMNMGANVGINVIYSGTVAAAVESAFLGVPAIAVSLHLGGMSGDRTKTNYPRAAEIARKVIDRVLEHELDPHGVVNINVPRTESSDAPMPPVRVVAMNTAPGIDAYDKRTSPHGQVYYWPSGSGMEFTHTAPDTDVEALRERCVTVTPLTYAMTDWPRLQTWRERLG